MAIEGTLKEKVKKLLTERGAWYYMPVPMGYGRRGIPDFLACYRGVFIAPETKVPKKEAKPWQERELGAINGAGGEAFVCKDISQLKNLLDFIDKRLDDPQNVPHIGG
jgi:hypothetical protein